MVAISLALLMLSPLFFSCSQQKSADMSDLLKTVPSSANGVVGINLSGMLKKIGCKIDGTTITPGKDVNGWLDKLTGDDRQEMEALLNGDSGIDPLGAILFYDANRTYITFAISDTEKFVAFVEKKTDAKFQQEDGGVSICQNIAMKGAQAWMLVSGRGFDTDLLVSYCNLTTAQSFIQNPFGAEIATLTKDIVGWGKVTTLINSQLSFTQISTLNVINNLLFEDATAVSFSVEFLKGEMKSSFTMLNDKGKPAKYLLPDDRIDVSLVKSIAENTNCLFAMSLNKKLIEKLENTFSMLIGQSSYKYIEALKNADGTFAFALGNDFNNVYENVKGVMTTDGNASIDLKSMLSNWAPISEDGKYIRFSRGTVQGTLDVAKYAEKLKGATIGLALSSDFISEVVRNDIESMVLKLDPDSGGMKFEFDLYGKENDQNILITLIQLFDKSGTNNFNLNIN